MAFSIIPTRKSITSCICVIPSLDNQIIYIRLGVKSIDKGGCMQRQTNISSSSSRGVLNVSSSRISPSAAAKEKMNVWHSIDKKEVIEEGCVIVGLVGVQFLYAGNAILQSYLLKLGIQPSALIIFSTFATFLILSPIAILFERKQWPSRITYKLFLQLLFLSFGGVTVFQSLFMKGVQLTSPAMATAMPNLAPGLIFFIACVFRLEKFELGCKYSRAKIGGTFVCVSGALIMSVMQSVTKQQGTREAGLKSGQHYFDTQTIIGCMYLIAAVFVLSTQVVLQAITLRDFTASISLCAITSFLGAIITAIVEIAEDQDWGYPGWPSLSIQQMVGYSIVAGSMSGMCVSLNAWAMKKKGPVMVSIFNPLGTVISALYSVALGESISIGSCAGMLLMFSGLYLVLWAKRNESIIEAAAAAAISKMEDDDENNDSSHQSAVYDIEKPLLA